MLHSLSVLKAVVLDPANQDVAANQLFTMFLLGREDHASA